MNKAKGLAYVAVLACAILALTGCPGPGSSPGGGDPGSVELSVVFDSRGGGSVATAKVQPGETVIEPLDLTNAENDDLIFSGWYTEAACENRWDFDDPVETNMTLYAKWNAADTLSFAAISGGTAWEVGKGTGTLDADLYIPAYYQGIPVARIANWAFLNCSGLKDVDLPLSVQALGIGAFNGSGITRIRLPVNVGAIAAYALSNCGSLTEITVDGENTSFKSVDGVLFNSALTYIWAYPAGKSGTSYSIPLGVTGIGPSAFGGALLTDVSIPMGVTAIEFNAFSSCAALNTVNIPTSVSYIGDRAFANSFYGAESTIFIPDSVDLGYYVFYLSKNLIIRCQAASEPEGWDANWNPSGLPVAWGCSN